MRKHLLTALAGCAAALVLALSVPRTALALPYHAADPELAGTAYAVLSPTTGELDFVRSTEGMSNMFYGCSSLTSLDVSAFDTAKVTGMADMFSYCSSLASLDVSGFDTSLVRSMYEMFNCCESLVSLDLSSFDTSKVTDMSEMFYGCDSLSKIAFGDRFVIN